MAEILIVSAVLPYPVTGGDSLRQYNLIKRVGRRHSVHLATFIHDKSQECGVDEMRKYCKGVHVVPAPKFQRCELVARFLTNIIKRRPLCASYHYVPVLEAKVRELMTKQTFDILQLEHVYMFEYVNCLPPSAKTRKILTLHNMESVKMKRQFLSEPFGQEKLRHMIDWWIMKSFEPRAMRRADKCIAMSEIEAAIARKMVPGINLQVVSNGVDTSLYKPVALNSSKELLFIGSLCYPPNVDGAQFFVSQVFPLIRKGEPEASLNLVGRSPVPRVKSLANGGAVKLFSDVPEVRPYYERSAISVVPLRAGGGTRLKILESMALGVPVVSTYIGCEGLDVTHGEDILIADSPEEFANNVCELLRNAGLRKKIAQNGRKLVENKYDWDIIAERLLDVYRELAGRSSR